MRGLPAILVLVVAIIVMLGSYMISIQQGEKQVTIRASTTTSLYATGLLERLAGEASKEWRGLKMEYIPVGSGEALRRAEDGGVCMVFVHAPSLELKYIEKGVIEEHRVFAYNYFIIVGPESDPAGVRNATSVVNALRRIYQAGAEGRAIFLSRGDNSGTHVKERSLWEKAGLSPDPDREEWYRETGQGMGETLVIAAEMGAYTLSDIGTYLKFHAEGRLPGLTILYSNDTELINIYSVYIVSSCEGPKRDAAEWFATWLAEGPGQDIIAGYGVEEYGMPLFYPAKGNLEWLNETWWELARGG